MKLLEICETSRNSREEGLSKFNWKSNGLAMISFKQWGGGYNLFSGKDHFNFSSGKYSHMLDYNKLFIFITFFVISIIIRQGIIDKYNNNKEIFIFLLSTRSGKWSLLKCFSSLHSTSIYYLHFFLVCMNCLKMWKQRSLIVVLVDISCWS